MKNIRNFNEFSHYCQGIAEALETGIDIKEYPQWNWSQVVFRTDAFGGSYACFHYDLTTGRVHNWYGTDHAEEITDCKQLAETVRTSLANMLKNRDMDAVSDFISSQYD